MGVSKSRGTPKWMVKITENPYFWVDTHIFKLFLIVVSFLEPCNHPSQVKGIDVRTVSFAIGDFVS